MKVLAIVFSLAILLVSCDPEQFHREYRLQERLVERHLICLKIGSSRPNMPRELVADGSSTHQILAYVPREIIKSENKVKLTTSAGHFLSNGTNSVTLLPSKRDFLGRNPCQDSAGIVQTPSLRVEDFLVSPMRAGMVRITMEVGEFGRTHFVEFDTASVEGLSVSTDNFAMTNSPLSKMVLTANARRSKGRPTPGQKIYFSVVRSDSVILDETKFTVTTSGIDADGNAKTIFTISDTAFVGEVKCKACFKPDQHNICDSMVIQVVSGS